MSLTETRSREWVFWKAVETAAVVCFLATLTVMFIQVVSRYAIGAAVPWTDETSRYLFICSVFLGAAICQLRSAQIRVTIVLDMLSPATRRWFETIQLVCTAVVAAALVVGCIKMAITSSNLRAATLPITFAWLYAVQGLGLLMILVISLRQIRRSLLAKAPGGTSK
jgi:TRAP-type C4-dicarboxylate transport system permease small subunit